MDGVPKAGGRGAGKAVLPGPAGSDASNAGAAPARAARRVPSPEDATAAADPPPAAAAGSGAGEEEDDEQVERFYALLDNIRAMRGAHGPSDGDGTGADGVEAGGGGARKRRLRAAEPPWRPAFRLEDFEEPSPTSPSDDDAARRAAKRTQRQDDAAAHEGGARPAVASSPPPPRRAGSRLDSGGRKSI